MTKLRVFLADDHAVIREGLKSLVNAQPDMETVGEAEDGRLAWQLAVALEPDVAVMDVSMPELNGIKATELLKQECPKIKVLALTVHQDQGYLRQILKAGASGYVLKKAVAEELILAIRTVAAGNTYIDPVLANNIVRSYLRDDSVPGRLLRSDLSVRETEVLRLIAWGYSNKEIAAQLNIGIKTVETYKARLMEKLELRSRVEIVLYALRQGWLTSDL
jgi:two-component system, NarL family, response regulator NreC